MSHTPGPWEWKATPYGDKPWLVPASVDITEFALYHRPILDSDPSGGEYNVAIKVPSPDATLIAAAPDLLTGLEAAVEALDAFDVANEMTAELRWMRATIAAAKKAKP